MMAGIRGKDTRPEMLIRRALHRLGFRYRLHARDLPGRPDLSFPRFHSVIFVHGCFWHGHSCHLFRWPSTRSTFWRAKIGRNRLVDRRAVRKLKADGWRVMAIWECALKGRTRLPLETVIRETARWLRKGRRDLVIRGTGGKR
jgi:DNA mismatch endonuclease (patch repair protein)